MVNAKQIRIGAKIFGHLTLCLELFLKKTTYNHGIIGSCLSFDHLRRFYAYFVSNSPKIGLFHRKPRTNFHFLPNLGEEILFLSFSRAILEVCFFVFLTLSMQISIGNIKFRTVHPQPKKTEPTTLHWSFQKYKALIGSKQYHHRTDRSQHCVYRMHHPLTVVSPKSYP